jgi:hypothetical protein
MLVIVLLELEKLLLEISLPVRDALVLRCG